MKSIVWILLWWYDALRDRISQRNLCQALSFENIADGSEFGENKFKLVLEQQFSALVDSFRLLFSLMTGLRWRLCRLCDARLRFVAADSALSIPR